MIAREHTEKVRLALRTTQTTLQGWHSVAGSHTSRFLGPLLHFGRARVRAASHFWQSLTLARRFYPTLQIPSPETASHTIASGEDVFEPWIVRSLPRRVHALIRFRVAIRIGSAVRANQAALLCQNEGWSAEQVSAASVGYDWSMFSELERLVLRYTDDLTRTPMDVDMGTLRALKRSLTDDQLVELATSIAQENFKARFHTGVGMSRAISEPAA